MRTRKPSATSPCRFAWRTLTACFAVEPYGRVAFAITPGDAPLDLMRSTIGYVFGSAASLTQVHVLLSNGSDDLAFLGPVFIDLEKIRATTPGVIVAPPHLPLP